MKFPCVGETVLGKLTAREVKAALANPGTYQDGDGLFLKVDKRGGASWVVRIQKDGLRRDRSIGSAKITTLAHARLKAADIRRAVIVEGRDPTAERKQAAAAAVTFREAATRLIDSRRHEWRNAKHAAQWTSTLVTYAYPSLGGLPVGEVTAGDIIAAITSVWRDKPETGRRVRQRVCAVLDYAHAQGWRATEAPARALTAGKGLPKQTGEKEHRKAMPYGEVPILISRLQERFSFGRLALEFTILTCVRSIEARGASWSEFDLVAGLWSVPGLRMKASRNHVVPLSSAALAVVQKAATLKMVGTDLLFPGQNLQDIMSDMTLLKSLRTLGYPYDVHGFRSSFRDWASETTEFPGEIAELCLAHKVGSEVERAYKRTTMLAKRRELMEMWGQFCHSQIQYR